MIDAIVAGYNKLDVAKEAYNKVLTPMVTTMDRKTNKMTSKPSGWIKNPRNIICYFNNKPVQLTKKVIGYDGKAMDVPRAPDGHYYLTLSINGTPVEFMVDTGATTVVLSRRDAERLGLDPASLVYLGEAQTANGTVRTARVKLTEVVLGPWRDEVVAASVTDGEMYRSLLGMDYLGKFHLELAADRLLLRR
jgi:clan AA aspartic protease (TIGR02281 family)